MGRERNPRRDEAMRLYLESDGEKQPKDIAAFLRVPASRVRKWKSEDKWDEELAKPKDERHIPKRRPCAPFGNKNAVGGKGGPGAPKGSRNAAGSGKSHVGKSSPALKTGEHAIIWEDKLTDEERQLLYGAVDVNPVLRLDEDIRLLSIRERRMMENLENLKANPEVEEEIRGYFDKEGKSRPKSFLRHKSPLIDRIILIEEALTRIQDKRIKAVKALHEVQQELSRELADKDIKITVVRKEIDL